MKSHLRKCREYLKDVWERLVHIEDKLNILLDEGKEGSSKNNINYRKSYAQYGEDALILTLFQIMGIEKPSYIDIGANYPYEISNTALMHDAGCWGINIEANPNLIGAFYRERPQALNICCGVGGADGEMPFYMIDGTSGRNSFDKNVVEQFVSDYPQFQIREVKMIQVKTLQGIFDEYKIMKMPDYMDIDIEGLEWEVLSCYDLKGRGPKILTMEVSQNKEKLITLMEDAGYFLYLKIGINYTNYTWIKNDYKEIIMRG